MDQRPFPQAVETERALLGGLMQAPDELFTISEIVTAEDFYRPDHGALFQLLLDMVRAGEHVDLVTVPTRVKPEEEKYGGVHYVVQLPDHAPSTANLEHYATVVKDKSLLRSMIAAGQEIANNAWSQPQDVGALLDMAARNMLTLGETRDTRSWTQVSIVIDDEQLRIQDLEKKGGDVTGYTTGFSDLDDRLAGLHPTDLLILAARPGMGKTALALNICQNAALLENIGVGIFSLEMGKGQLVTRMLCCLGKVDGGRVRTGKLTSDDWSNFLDASDILRRAKMHIDDTPGLSITDVKARARRLKAIEPDLGLIVIDYLQLMRGDDPRAPREQQIASISRGLKGLAKDLNIPVIALSQLNRGVESRADKRPLVSDLRESGAIEQDADVIMFIYRDEVYNPETDDQGLAEVIIAKQRNGPTGTVKLVFLGQYTRFDNYADDPYAL